MFNLNWLKQTISQHYDLGVLDADMVRDAWHLSTTAGPKCFKRTNLSQHKVQFVAAAIEHLLKNGFNETVPLIKTVDDKVFCEVQEGIHYLTDWIPGHEANPDSVQDACDAATALAKLHQASHGFIPPLNCKPREGWGRLPNEWLKHTTELEQYLSIAQREQVQEDFTALYLATSPCYIARCKTALEILSTCNYPELVKTAKLQGSLCHRDFTYHNLIIKENGELSVIDFDYCNQDIRTYDIGRYIRKIAKHFQWQMAPVKLVLHTYNQNSNLSKTELIFLLAFAYFPQRYWRIANRYYSKPNEDKESLYKQLQHETKTIDKEETFLRQLSFEIAQGILTGRC